MEKVYLLIQDYVTDLNPELKVDVYKTKKSAKIALKDAVAESKPNDKENGYNIETNNSTEYEAYEDGNYPDNHSHIYIKEVEVKS